jgi:hypothetical protein
MTVYLWLAILSSLGGLKPSGDIRARRSLAPPFGIALGETRVDEPFSPRSWSHAALSWCSGSPYVGCYLRGKDVTKFCF